MAELKTKKSQASVEEFLAGVADERRRTDARVVCALMTEATGVPPVMWGTSIVGFGSYRYRYASGQRGEWPAVGFSPRKQNLTVYLSAGFDRYEQLLSQLGEHTTGKSCLYLKRLSDVDSAVLRRLVQAGFAHLDGKTITPGSG